MCSVHVRVCVFDFLFSFFFCSFCCVCDDRTTGERGKGRVSSDSPCRSSILVNDCMVEVKTSLDGKNRVTKRSIAAVTRVRPCEFPFRQSR